MFVRELISNASDAMERLRFLQASNEVKSDGDLRLRIFCDPTNKTLTFWDGGVGMKKEEMIKNLGTIARSGSRAFLEEKQGTSSPTAQSIIGQFGVGFYSGFVVADRIEVFSSSALIDAPSNGYRWASEGTGDFEVEELSSDDARCPPYGTKIILHMKDDLANKFCDSKYIEATAKKFSSFVNFPVEVDGVEITRSSQPWLSSNVTPEEHSDFFKHLSGHSTGPRFTMSYQTDAPLSIRSVFYIPSDAPPQSQFQPTADSNVALHSRRVLVSKHANDLIPHWLRFIHGIVDCDDMPMNIARESMQDTALMKKLGKTITNRLIRWLLDEARKQPEAYNSFFKDYHVLIKAGILESSPMETPAERESKLKLLRYDSSASDSETFVSLEDYISRMKENQEVIFYLTAPSRAAAVSFPLMEYLKKKNIEVLFMTHEVDEFLSSRLSEYKGKQFVALGDPDADIHLEKIENAGKTESEEDKSKDESRITSSDEASVIELFQNVVPFAIVSINQRLDSHPAVAVGGLTKIMKQVNKQSLMAMLSQGGQSNFDEKMVDETLNQFQLQLNPTHPHIHLVNKLKSSSNKTDNAVAHALAKQIASAARLSAGYIDDPRDLVGDMLALVHDVNCLVEVNEKEKQKQ